MTLSPNMSLSVPTVGVDVGPTYAYQINTSLSLIDSHDHSAGKGVQITPPGLNINSNLTFQNNQATSMGAAVFQNQASLATLNALYAVGSELWYNDATGAVQITSNGAVNATTGSLVSGSASAAFAGGVLQVYSNLSNSTPGNVQCGSVLLGNNSAGSNFLTLQPPSLTGGGYSLTLPTIPGSTKFMTLDASGVMSTASSISGAQLATGTLTGGQLANGTITTTQIANLTIVAGNIANATLTGTQIASNTVTLNNLTTVSNTTATGSGYSNSTTTPTTICSSSFTSTNAGNRPLFFSFSGASITFTQGISPTTATIRLRNTTDSVTLASWVVDISSGSIPAEFTIPASAFSWSGVTSSSSTATFALQAFSTAVNSATISTLAGVTMTVFQV